ncbi:uncharacterized protein [Physcomitrium patens]|uniref:E2F/DP family winged-helix DNA-binding domain-containing protein n=1 Tax=Physcomitrium patens TaxID=3218 RepID=A0A7I4CIK3_PHYPA|nr:uncharacterized protein LOC112276549 [Physcomitrium patens]XP_024363725.1 uncharacterized protein LOC112276549 [Physcomitrium patens]|eukprot:XP_024363724.1 uncharacterized protein LOC112276549 [Physcomitrella patens]
MATNDDTIAEELNVREKASAHEPRIPLAVVVSPGSICGRIRANPLKHLASLLHEKLMAAQGGPCNLLQVATEIHSQAEDKHNTTLRRIYDVVNVCEGAGVIVRTGQRSPKSKKASASGHIVPPKCFPSRRTGKRSLRGGATIQWLSASSYNILGESDSSPPSPCKSRKILLETERRETFERILQKKRVCDTLSKQVAILQKLMEQNQSQCRLNQCASGSMGCTEVEFPAHLRMPRSLERASTNTEVASVRPGMEFSKIILDRDIYAELNNLDCEYLVNQQRLCTSKLLHLPFVMLATNPDANLNIYMMGDPPHEVRLQLDRNYCLMDHIQMIKMLPRFSTM